MCVYTYKHTLAKNVHLKNKQTPGSFKSIFLNIWSCVKSAVYLLGVFIV